MTRRELAGAFGLPLERIRVVAEPIGGAFGGKFALVEPLAAGATLVLRRPVRLTFTRAEDFQATNPASAQVSELRVGARKDGTLTAIQGADDRRPRDECGLGSRGDHVSARSRSLPLGSLRRPRLRRADEPLHVRRISCPGRSDRGVRARVAARRPRSRARPRPARASPEERGRPGRHRGQRQPLSGHRHRRGARAHPRAPALGAARLAARGGGRRLRGRRTGPAAPSPPPPSVASTRTGR